MNRAASPEDRQFMLRALALAERGWGRVHPNPMVGALVVSAGQILGEGWHAEYGGPHAEVRALLEAGPAARGATLYVSLEPCSHRGKTPPCTGAIEEAGISRVVYAADDPHPGARGGADRLRRAGLDVTGGVEREAARTQNAAFFHTLERGGPYVALKLGLSLDGRIAASAGQRTEITGAASWSEVHRLRAGHDAVLIGIGTALSDDPLLTPRGDLRPRRPAARVVLDSRARLPVGSRLVRSVDDAPVWVCCGSDAPRDRRARLESAGVSVLELPYAGDRSRLDLDVALEGLMADDRTSVLAEGGSRVAASLLSGDHLQRLYLFYAPVLLGGDAVPAFAEIALPKSMRWRSSRLAQLGEDVMVVLERAETPRAEQR